MTWKPHAIAEPEAITEEAVSRAFRALGHPHRFTIVRALLTRAIACCPGDSAEDCRLDARSCNVGHLAALVEIHPSTLSHHLKELDDAGVIERTRAGRFIYCRVNEPLLDQLAAILRPGSGAGDPAPAEDPPRPFNGRKR